MPSKETTQGQSISTSREAHFAITNKKRSIIVQRDKIKMGLIGLIQCRKRPICEKDSKVELHEMFSNS